MQQRLSGVIRSSTPLKGQVYWIESLCCLLLNSLRWRSFLILLATQWSVAPVSSRSLPLSHASHCQLFIQCPATMGSRRSGVPCVAALLCFCRGCSSFPGMVHCNRLLFSHGAHCQPRYSVTARRSDSLLRYSRPRVRCQSAGKQGCEGLTGLPTRRHLPACAPSLSASGA